MATNNSLNAPIPFAVPNGGTGVATMTTAYAPICAGTTATGAVQVASTGLSSSGFVLTSNGSSALPSFQAPGASFTWVAQSTGTVTMAVNTGYYITDASAVTLTLPTTAAAGTLLAVAGYGAGGWTISQNALQEIFFGNVHTTIGTGGSLASSNQYDQVQLLCTVANTDWVVISSVGNITYV